MNLARHLFSFFLITSVSLSSPSIHAATVQEKIDTKYAQLVGKENIEPAKKGTAILLGALGIVATYLIIRQCPCLQNKKYIKTEHGIMTEKEKYQLAGLAAAYSQETIHTETEKIRVEQPGCMKRLLQCIFCVKQK